MDSKNVTKGSHTPIVRRTTNHIYEHCDSVTILGMHGQHETRPVIQLSRDVIELMDGSTKGKDVVQATRLTYATVVMERDAAKKLADALLNMLGETGADLPSGSAGEE